MADADACDFAESFESNLFTHDEATSPTSSVINTGARELTFTANSNSKIMNFDRQVYNTCLAGCDADYTTCADGCANEITCLTNCHTSHLGDACSCSKVLDCDLAVLDIDECDIWYAYGA